jgi:menaquinone-specific isochorismate synthase
LKPGSGTYIPRVSTFAPSQPDSVAHLPVRFRTARRTLPVGDPIAFLRAMEGTPRGFWARGARWVAHAGVLGVLSPSSLEEGRTRFAAVEAMGRSWSEMGDGEEALRFYGGFSFRDGHQPSGHWGAFPAALFHLPLVEFDGEGAGEARLRVRVPEGNDPAEAQRTAEAEADRLVELLRAPTGLSRDARRAEAVDATVVEGARREWLGAVERTLDSIRAGGVSKAVLARTRDVELAEEVATVDVLAAIWNQHHSAHAFLFEPVAGSRLLGAAPEILVTLRDSEVFATAVAGSARRGRDPAEDARLGQALMRSPKDRAEHQAVVDAIVDGLEKAADAVVAPDEPHILTLARIQHLQTEIRAHPRASLTALDLLEELHPTPAVCGVPRERALELLADFEPFDRGWYAGPVGWFDTEGEGHFVPALRMAVSNGPRWRLFAGAGIVDGSQPAMEWDETGLKFVPVLRALAAAGARLDDVEP